MCVATPARRRRRIAAARRGRRSVDQRGQPVQRGDPRRGGAGEDLVGSRPAPPASAISIRLTLHAGLGRRRARTCRARRPRRRQEEGAGAQLVERGLGGRADEGVPVGQQLPAQRDEPRGALALVEQLQHRHRVGDHRAAEVRRAARGPARRPSGPASSAIVSVGRPGGGARGDPGPGVVVCRRRGRRRRRRCVRRQAGSAVHHPDVPGRPPARAGPGGRSCATPRARGPGR